MSQARLREALNAGGPGSKDKTPPVADGILSVTPDTPEAEEWKNRRSAIDNAAACSTYLDDDEDAGPQPSDLYGKFTWKIEKFSEISKRELRSTVFEVGNYKWYILVYPQGCDVCNHLSLFLCVADYDKLLPGWSHFAQFTIAVVNKDPKKSKYSDTLHRFCKKEHDWGWKKFMELSKILEGFTVQDTLVIKAQVQVIRDRVNRPFRCLDPQYRRELVRVYLTNVEGICRRFMEEKRDKLQRLQTEVGFTNFWSSLDARQQRALVQEKGEILLKGLVKRFFNEKEVTSTLVMDALYCGSKQLEEASRLYMQQGNLKGPVPLILIDADKNVLILNGDILEVLEKAVCDNLPPMRDEKAGDALAVRSAQDSDEYNKDSVERDERRLAELGKRTVEIYSLAYVFFERVEAAYNEAESIKRQDALIREEEELERLEDERAAARAAADKEKKARKKERKKAKKEAEKARREAEEAERKRVEDKRREELERKQREAMEKRRQEEEQTKAILAKSKEAARPLQKPRPKVPVKQTAERTLSREDSDKPQTSAKNTEDYYQADRALTQDEERAQTELVSSTSCSNYRRSTSDSALSNASSTIACVDEEVDNESTASTDEEVTTLREHITWLESQLTEKDAEIFALRARIVELQAGDTATTTTLNSVSYTVDAGSGSSSSSSRPPSRTDSQEDSIQLKSQASSRPASASETPAAATNGGILQENGMAHSQYNPHRGLNPSAVAYRSHSVPVPGAGEGLTAATTHQLQQARPTVMLHPSSGFPLGPPPFLPLSTAGPPPEQHGLSHRGKPGVRVPMGNGHLSGRAVGTPPQMMSGMSRQDSKSMGLHRSNSDSKGVNMASSTSYAGPMQSAVGMGSRNMHMPVGGPPVSDNMLSYRNAAMNAGVMPMAPLQSQPQVSANVSSSSQRHIPNSHAPPGPGGSRMPQHLPNGKGPFGTPPPQLVVQAHRQQGPGLQFAPPQHPAKPAMSFPSSKRVDNGGNVDSPGLDDFAHMGLITDLLE